MKKSIKTKRYHRLLIQVYDNDKKGLFTDANGEKFYYTKWIEVPEANLGSIKKPNTDILAFKFEPINLEKDKLRRKYPGHFPFDFGDEE